VVAARKEEEEEQEQDSSVFGVVITGCQKSDFLTLGETFS